MNYADAVLIVTNNYSLQSDLLISSLDPQAIITLAQLCNQNTNRSMTTATIARLSKMEPHRQCGFLANPFLEWIIGNCLTATPSPATATVSTPNSKPANVSNSTSKSKSKSKPKPEPEPEPEPDLDPEPEIDLFGMF